MRGNESLWSSDVPEKSSFFKKLIWGGRKKDGAEQSRKVSTMLVFFKSEIELVFQKLCCKIKWGKFIVVFTLFINKMIMICIKRAVIMSVLPCYFWHTEEANSVYTLSFAY